MWFVCNTSPTLSLCDRLAHKSAFCVNITDANSTQLNVFSVELVLADLNLETVQFTHSNVTVTVLHDTAASTNKLSRVGSGIYL